MPNQLDRSDLKEWGADASFDNRPGVPMELEVGPLTTTVSRQVPDVPIIHKRPELNQLTPAFGTSCPPKGLSGAIRRSAYKIPDDRAAHWMLLILGDRVDVAESLVGDLVKKPGAGLLITLGVAAAAIMYLRRRERAEVTHYEWC